MSEEIRLAIATSVLHGLVSHNGASGMPEGIRLDAAVALQYADALIEASRPRAPQAGGRLPLAEPPPASDAERDRERPSTAPAERRLPPAPAPPASSRGEVLRSPPAPRQCEAPECGVEGTRRLAEALIDGRKRDVEIWLCNLHFAGIPPSILIEWHRAFRNGKELARAG